MVPLIVVVLIALAIFFSPILALILLVLALVGLGVIKYVGPGTEPDHAPPLPEVEDAAPPPTPKGGLWGEVWPERREQEETRISEEQAGGRHDSE